MKSKRLIFASWSGLLAVVLWFVGFYFFSFKVFEYEQEEIVSSFLSDSQQALDDDLGIVALTGGRNRIDKAFLLLKQGVGKHMLISGVERGITLAQILQDKKVVLSDNQEVDLGYVATDTVGNALETKDWVEKRGLEKIFVVTSFYHIPRVQLEFERLMPKVKIAYVAVKTGYVLPKWWEAPHSFWFLAKEYCKYLVVYVQYKVLGL